MPPRPAARVLVMALAAGCSSSTAVPDGAAAAADAPASTDGPRPDSPAPKADAPSPTADAPAPTADAPAASTYSTTFDATEAPISEGGAWTHVGLDWTLVDTGGGIAFGTQTGTGGYDDSYAHLSGFPPDHGASGVIFRSPSLDGVVRHARGRDPPPLVRRRARRARLRVQPRLRRQLRADRPLERPVRRLHLPRQRLGPGRRPRAATR